MDAHSKKRKEEESLKRKMSRYSDVYHVAADKPTKITSEVQHLH
jgi:hypothetical protein